MGLSSSAYSLLLLNTSRNSGIQENIDFFHKKHTSENRIVYLECTPTHLVAVSIGPKKLRAHLTVIGFSSSLPKIKTQVEGISASLGFDSSELDRDFLKDLLRRDFIKTPPIEKVFIQGTPSVPSQQSQAKLIVKPYQGQAEYQEDEHGKMNYSDLNLFDNVISGQHIADFVPPKKGLPGRDIYGQLLSVESIVDTPISCGPGIAYDEMQQKFFTEAAGYVTYEDRKLNLEQTYNIYGDVDLSVGVINFISNVHVRGDVLPDFSISAGGNISIDGTVSGASIQAEGNLKMLHGVLGQDKSIVKAGKDATMKFANESTLEIQGSLTLTKEALNSELNCFNEIDARDAVIIGGRVVSLKNITVNTLGSELGIKTQIFLGEDYTNLKRTDEVRQQILEKKETLENRLEGAYTNLKYWQVEHNNENYTVEELEKLLNKFEEIKSMAIELKNINQEFQLLSTEKPQDRVARCDVLKTIYPGTIFFFSGVIYDVKEEIKGPVSVIGEESSKGRYKISIKNA